MMRKLIKLVLMCAVLATLFLYGFKIYVTRIDPLKPRLEAQVQALEKEYNVRPISYENIPKFYIEAVIATEDRRFFSDPGIDPIGILRSAVVDVSQKKYAQGGSTITQQLVDNTYLSRNKSMMYKLTQSLYAIGIYDTVPKKEVFEMYANLIYFGEGAYGLNNASNTYFKKRPPILNKGELAMLAGIPNSPNNFDPLTHYDQARAREQAVLGNMVAMSYLTENEAKQIFDAPIRLKKGK